MSPLLRVLLVAAALVGPLALAGCTDKLSLSAATLDEPDFDLSPLKGDASTVFQVDAGPLSKYNVTWDWGDGTFTYGGASEHKYGFTNGIMTITLIATADDGTQGIHSREITLGTGINKDPTATLRVGRTWVEIGKNVTLTAGGSDPDRDPLTYLYTRARLDGDKPGQEVVVGGNGKTTAVSFDEPGRYVVKVRAKDPKGGEATAQAFVDVSRTIPSNVFEAVFNGTIRAGTLGAAASQQAWLASPPAPDTDVDATRHFYTLDYPGNTVVMLTWNDTTTVGGFDLDLELRNAANNETIFKAENHAVNPTSPGAPTPLPPFEFNVTTQEPGTYFLIVRGHTGVDVKYTALVYASLKITPEMVAATEGRA